MQSPPFRILGINNNNPRHAGNTPPKNNEPGVRQGQLSPIPVTNPSIRAGQHGGDRGEGEQGAKATGSTKKRTPFTGDGAHAAPDANDTLLAHPATGLAADDDNVFADSLRTPQGEAESEGEEEATAAAPAAKKWHASNPYRPGCCGTLLFSSLRHQYPKDLPQGTTLLIKSGYCEPPRRKRQGRSSGRMTWWM